MFFVICMESNTLDFKSYAFCYMYGKVKHLILKVVEDGTWKCIKARRSGPKISHLILRMTSFLFKPRLSR